MLRTKQQLFEVLCAARPRRAQSGTGMLVQICLALLFLRNRAPKGPSPEVGKGANI